MRFENVTYQNAGQFTSRETWTHPSFKLKTTEIIVVIEGTLFIEEEGVRYTVGPGEVILLEAGRQHAGWQSTDQPISFYWFHFTSDEPFGDGGSRCFPLRERYPVTILCRQILHYENNGFAHTVAESLFSVLLAELEAQSAADDNTEGALVSRIREWIRINSDRSLTAPEVAEHFGYNEDYVTRLFKASGGEGLKAVISEQRMNHIKRLLLETDLTLTELAEASGFTDYKLFLKFFKYHEGMTPTEFRQVYYSTHTNNR